MARRDTKRSTKALAKAHSLAERGDVDGARRMCREILGRDQAHAGANFLMGTLAGESGDLVVAVEHLERAGDEALVRYNLANAYRELGRHAEALGAFRGVTAEAPTWAPGHYGLGTALRSAGDPKAARKAFQRCVSLDPEFALAWLQVSELAQSVGDIPGALSAASRCVAADPRASRGHRRLGLLQTFYGSKPLAEASLKAALALQPDDVFAQHMLSALTGVVVERPPDAYVTELFDAYADTFDRHLVDVLAYQAPELVARRVRALGRSFARAADLGCGTGLSGVAIRDMVGNLVGLDLSPAMLDLARKRGVYDTLVAGPIESLEGSFDLLLAVDVLVYVGELEDVFGFLRGRCEADAHLIFTTERGAGGTHLQPNGRYSHAREEVEAICERTGFAVLSVEDVNLRREREDWVGGQVWVAKAH